MENSVMLKMIGSLIQEHSELVELVDELLIRLYEESLDLAGARNAFRMQLNDFENWGCISIHNIENQVESRKKSVEKNQCK